MIPFREALDLLLNHVRRMEAEPCRLEEASGRVLRQEIRADRAFPPFDRVMMDGYALRSADLDSDRKFRVTGSAPAGKPRASMAAEAGTCIEAMTGAPAPDGADCIVPVERTTRGEGNEIVVDSSFKSTAGPFIHRAGSDAAEGDILLQPGVLLGSREIGVAASCGAAVVEVSRQPRVTIVPTGDELVAVDAMPAVHQIRQSNGHAIHAALLRAGFHAASVEPLNDDAGVGDLRAVLESSDWIIVTGAISKGARDFVPALLDSLGCTRLFHGVAQRPGKPAGCWTGPQQQLIGLLKSDGFAALAVYDMCKALNKGIRIQNLHLVSKTAAKPAACLGTVRMPDSSPGMIRRAGKSKI